MISAEMRADIPKDVLSLEEGYDRVGRILHALAEIVPSLTDWYGGISAPQQDYVNFSDRSAILGRIQERIDALKAEFPSLPNADGFTLRLSSSKAKKRRAGLFELSYEPARGVITLDAHEPDIAFGRRVLRVVDGVLAVIASMEDVQYAFVDVRDRVPDRPRPTTYRLAYATYPHRKAVGWMAYVPEAVTSEQVPSAAELVPVPGKGTIIVSVADAFDLNDKAHIERANRVEMELVDLGLLPVTDPDLL